MDHSAFGVSIRNHSVQLPNGRQTFPYMIREELPVIRQLRASDGRNRPIRTTCGRIVVDSEWNYQYCENS